MKNMSPTIRFLFTLTVMHVSRDMVVGSYKVPSTCGACAGDNSTCRMFSGIFTKPQLPAGYNVVTTIPTGACSVSVAELKSSRNHLALRQADGGFILNGNWTTNWSGNYKESDNGATFTYIRPGEDSAESIYSPGPLHTPVELLIFYREPNPGIQYKYQLPVSGSQQENTSKLFHH
uniref:ADAMTS/ADAMTS-like Spacer 1 domain-containing protein n=1 Tax=Clastoptera arizonana TaxID=38151 RepID=A0A1B6D846_9HEMI